MSTKKPEFNENCLYGLAGEIVNIISPHTESDKAALYSQLLAYFGNIIGRSAHFTAEATQHYTNLFVLLVGMSSKGRKGSSLSQIQSLFDDECFRSYKEVSICKGLSSGEGLIYRVKDMDGETNSEVKKLLCLETEFGTVLKNISRQGNNLSNVLRQAWDSSSLESLTKNDPVKSKGAHISVIGHITFDELKVTINPVDIKNGLGNRFIFFCTQRSKRLPDGSTITTTDLSNIKAKIKEAFNFALTTSELKFDHDARNAWNDIYECLGAECFGIVGDLSGRAEAQVRRIATILAVMNQEITISPHCLFAAWQTWLYSVESIKYIFGDNTGNTQLDKIIDLLAEAGSEGLTKTDITRALYGNFPIGRLLETLTEMNKVALVKKKSPNSKKPTSYYYLLQFAPIRNLEENEGNINDFDEVNEIVNTNA